MRPGPLEDFDDVLEDGAYVWVYDSETDTTHAGRVTCQRGRAVNNRAIIYNVHLLDEVDWDLEVASGSMRRDDLYRMSLLEVLACEAREPGGRTERGVQDR